jgi:hypothetical protein
MDVFSRSSVFGCPVLIEASRRADPQLKEYYQMSNIRVEVLEIIQQAKAPWNCKCPAEEQFSSVEDDVFDSAWLRL